jgi:hypothetical protein
LVGRLIFFRHGDYDNKRDHHIPLFQYRTARHFSGLDRPRSCTTLLLWLYQDEWLMVRFIHSFLAACHHTIS